MKFLHLASKCTALLMAATTLLVSIPVPAAQAALISTDRVIEKREIAADRAAISAFLGRDDVKRQLVEMGVKPAEASARVDSLSDREVRMVAAHLGTAPAGQGGAGVALAVIGVNVLFVILIYLIIIINGCC